MSRTFEDKPAHRERVPLLIGLVGPSGGGKTGSALELAHGIQDVTGGDIFYIDTEAKRALHYAEVPSFSDKNKIFRFRHLEFGAPFGPMDYLAAIDHCVKKGAKTIVVDSMSHEHEGSGGVLEMHEAELTRIAGTDWSKRDKCNMLAWQKPKADRRKLINTILQYPVNFIFCFRAKEKIKMAQGKAPEARGWQPIAGEEFVFEMTLNCLLPPGVNGVPEWNPEEKAERQMIKLPQQFKNILTPGRPLSMAIGRELATWAEGSHLVEKPTAKPVILEPHIHEPSPELLRLTFLQDTLDKWETELNPDGVEIARLAIVAKDHARISDCLKSLRKGLEPKGVVFPEVTW